MHTSENNEAPEQNTEAAVDRHAQSIEAFQNLNNIIGQVAGIQGIAKFHLEQMYQHVTATKRFAASALTAIDEYVTNFGDILSEEMVKRMNEVKEVMSNDVDELVTQADAADKALKDANRIPVGLFINDVHVEPTTIAKAGESVRITTLNDDGAGFNGGFLNDVDSTADEIVLKLSINPDVIILVGPTAVKIEEALEETLGEEAADDTSFALPAETKKIWLAYSINGVRADPDTVAFAGDVVRLQDINGGEDGFKATVDDLIDGTITSGNAENFLVHLNVDPSNYVVLLADTTAAKATETKSDDIGADTVAQ